MSNNKNDMSPSIKYCIVPQCKNTATKTPEKLFFYVPKDPKIRKKWINVTRRAHPLGPKTIAYCCEDHFDVENDMQNYVKYKLVGGPLKLKKDVLPHKFACQNRRMEKPERSLSSKLNAKSRSEIVAHAIATMSQEIEHIYVVDPVSTSADNTDIDPLPEEHRNSNPDTPTTQNKKNQVNLKKKVAHKSTETKNKYIRSVQGNKQKPLQCEVISCSSFEESSSLSKENCNLESAYDTESESEFEKVSFKIYMQKAALLCVSREPQLLLGLPKKWYCSIQLLSESCKNSPRDVMIVLKKIRLYQSNALLGLDFGMSSVAIGKIFRKTLSNISSCMKKLIFFPKPSQVVELLPIPFRKRYSNVQSIIDCLEIQIEKPTNAVQQALTWSEYKSCNTIKYLISITPDGRINFISEGYGGRTSYSFIFQDCGIMDSLPKNAAVIADRGFKNVAHLICEKECILIKHPSVNAKITPTKEEVLETKKIAALRIHVERSIGRLRNFEFLKPHATVDLKNVGLLDDVINTACGIVNFHCLRKNNEFLLPLH